MTVARATGARYRSWLPPAFLFVAGLIVWEATVVLFDIRGFLLPKPSVIAGTYLENQSVVWAAALVTFREAVGGFVMGGLAGVLVALVTTRWERVRRGAMPFAIALNSAPIIALAPIFNAWFGSTNPVSKMAVVAVMVFFPVMINMVRGLTSLEPAELELFRSYATSEMQVLWKLRLPHSLPYLFSAFKVGAVLSLIGAIVAEYFGGPTRALGVYISQQAAGTRFAEAWSAIIVGSILGVALYVVVALAERWAIPWHPSLRRGGG